MSYPRPTLSALANAALADISTSGLPVSPLLLPQSVLQILALVQARFALDHYSYLDQISLNSVPWSSENEYLEGWAALKSIIREGAVPAAGTGLWSGVIGTVIPAATTITRADGYAYLTTASVTFVTTSATVAFTASTPGLAGNAPTGTVLTIGGTLGGVVSNGAASGAIVGGANQETDTSLRNRMISEYASPAQGGSALDFENFTYLTPGVTRAWATNGSAAGTVLCYAMLDVVNAAYSGFPQGTSGTAAAETRGTGVATGDLLNIANVIYPLRPVTSLVYAEAPVAQPVSLSITGLTPTSGALQVAISLAVAELFVDVGSPLGMSVYPSDIYQAVEATATVQHFTLASPTAAVVVAAGSLPTLASITFS